MVYVSPETRQKRIKAANTCNAEPGIKSWRSKTSPANITAFFVHWRGRRVSIKGLIIDLSYHKVALFRWYLEGQRLAFGSLNGP